MSLAHGRRQAGRRRAAGGVAGRCGFSLLEVILALAIFGGAIVVLGELARIATRNAAAARDLTDAELLCESKLAELLASESAPQPIQGALETDDPDVPWLYSVEVEPLAEEGLLLVRVTVGREDGPAGVAGHCTLSRWMIDPEYAATAAAALMDESSQQTE